MFIVAAYELSDCLFDVEDTEHGDELTPNSLAWNWLIDWLIDW